MRLGRPIQIMDAARSVKAVAVIAKSRLNFLAKLPAIVSNWRDETQTPSAILITLASLGIILNAYAVLPPPDGGYPNGNMAEGQNALQSLTPGGFNAAVGYFSLFANTIGSFTPQLALERSTSTPQATIQPWVLQRFCSTPSVATTRPLE
jgi:hypothetical protein